MMSVKFSKINTILIILIGIGLYSCKNENTENDCEQLISEYNHSYDSFMGNYIDDSVSIEECELLYNDLLDLIDAGCENTSSFAFTDTELDSMLDSTYCTELFEIEYTYDGEMGMRNDRDSSLYLQFGANRGQFNAGVDYPDFSPVGCIFNASDSITASGTLIGNKWVLTAAHNFLTSGEDEIELGPQDVTFRFGPDYNLFTDEINIAQIYYHPAWENNLESGDSSGFDIALVELEDSVDFVEPATYYTGLEESLGGKIIIAGYGDAGAKYDIENWSFRRAFENILDRKINGLTSENPFDSENDYPIGGLIGFDFDSPYENTNTLNIANDNLGPGDSDPSPLNLEGMAISGDSGGPCFLKIEDEWQIIGVCSFSDTTDYGGIGVYTRVSTHKDWIINTMNPNIESEIINMIP